MITLVFEHITWDQAWEMLTKMAGNPECTELIMVNNINTVTLLFRDS